MKIETIVVTPFQQNTRIIIDEHTMKGAVVDPGGEIEKILAAIRAQAVKIESVILTHAHIDHVGGVGPFIQHLQGDKKSGPLLYAHRLEKGMRQSISEQALMFGLNPDEYQNVPEPDVFLDQGSEIPIGSIRAKALHTPGHAPGHICLYFPEENPPILIAGDTLFAGSIGRTDLQGGDYATLLKSIQEQILTLPDDTVVMSGHGPDTTVKNERHTNPFLMLEH